jgi:hypothetical protein
MRNNQKQSQMMMRARVFFQFCALASLTGGIYYKTYAGGGLPSAASLTLKPTRDNRAFLNDPHPSIAGEVGGVDGVAEGGKARKEDEMR